MVATLLPSIITAYPRIALEKSCGTELLGYYSNVSTPTVLMITVVPSILMPIMAIYGDYVQNGSYDKLIRGMLVSFAGTVGLGAICLAGIKLCGKQVMVFLFTSEIEPYVWHLYPLFITMTVYALTICGNSVLIAFRRNKAVTSFIAVALIVCIAIGKTLVEEKQIIGAIAVLLISYSAQFVLQIVFIYRTVKRQKYNLQ